MGQTHLMIIVQALVWQMSPFLARALLIAPQIQDERKQNRRPKAAVQVSLLRFLVSGGRSLRFLIGFRRRLDVEQFNIEHQR